MTRTILTAAILAAAGLSAMPAVAQNAVPGQDLNAGKIAVTRADSVFQDGVRASSERAARKLIEISEQDPHRGA